MAILMGCNSILKPALSAIFCATILVGCDNFSGANDTNTASVKVDGGQLKIEERDVDAPDVYRLKATGLWDGRPSLGGIWVAVPDNVEPDRVRITNLDNNRQVIGSLFRKEVSIQGPPILVSADAANAIGLTAGKPAKMSIVVLRRETVEISAPPVPIKEEAADKETTTDVAGIPETEGLSTAALETTVLEAIDEAPVKPAENKTAAETPEVKDVETVAPVTPVKSSVKNPFIQVASVNSPKAANQIVKKLQAGGVSAETRIKSAGEKSTFRVVVGPVIDAADQSAKLKKIRSLGFKDAFPTK